MYSSSSRSPLGKSLLYSTAGLALMAMVPNTVQAQDTQSAEAELESIIVTGSRIVRDGFEAPTPVSVLSVDDLNVIATPNIADAVNRLPALQGSLGTSNASTNVSSGTGGVNNLNLRALAAVRTLVLLDGKRIVGASLAGFENNGSVPDINGFPGGLVSRVDVVTGGASAAYGSDALAGVVNFVLDREYTGIKGDIQGGVTSFGDDENYKVSLTAGSPFGGGRGHFLFFGEHTYSAGVNGNGKRPWSIPENSQALLKNPSYTATNGQPEYFHAKGVGVRATAGGLIIADDVNGTASPLRGIQFLRGGVQAPFNFGTQIGSFMWGGDYKDTNIWMWPTLDLEVQRTNFFTRGSYDITDNINAYAELSWAYTHAVNNSVVPNFEFGMNIKSDNPFIPANIKSQMTAGGMSSLTVASFYAHSNKERFTLVDGTTPLDIKVSNGRTLRRYVAGFEGNFDAMDKNWDWEAYYARSTTHNSTRSPNNIRSRGATSPHDKSLDSVIDPVSGGIVCRSTLTNPGNGCIPFNPFGTHVNTGLHSDWATSTGYAITILSQDVWAASISGEPLELWAGPVSLAAGVEHRIEKVKGLASDFDRRRRLFAGNYMDTNAKWHVTEGFAETVVPLAKGEPWAQSLDFNAAIRGAQYSESGFEFTWKAGLTYTPADEYTFRFTQSRDIRAPNLGDLFNAGRAGTGQAIDPWQNNKITNDVVTAVVGNPNAKPERADTTGVGIVYSPDFLPGFTASLDYYRIKIKGALFTIARQDMIDGCFAGATAYCASISRLGGGIGGNVTGDINYVASSPQNALSQLTDGIDFEFGYNFPLDMLGDGWAGELSLRGLANYVFRLDTTNVNPATGEISVIKGAGIIPDSAGIGIEFGEKTAHFRWNASATYSLDDFSGTLTWRGTGSGVYNNKFVVCRTACPTSTSAAPTITENSIPAVHYFDAAVNYKIMDGNVTLYGTVQNLLNTPPPIISANSRGGWYGGWDHDNYDRIGRMFRAGVRFSY